MAFYRRLPHWHPEGATIFLTWRLFGSLPKTAIETRALTAGQRFVAQDRELDAAAYGPTWLKDGRVASCVVNTLQLAEEKWELCELHAWVVMSNHVHVLLGPKKPLADVTRSIKKISARQANLILSRTGQPFWQDESYDHWVRNGREFDRIVAYIEANPVRAGLVQEAAHWRWSSAWGRQVGNLPHKSETLGVGGIACNVEHRHIGKGI
jgi:REP element-mobilizing transposase RayT